MKLHLSALVIVLAVSLIFATNLKAQDVTVPSHSGWPLLANEKMPALYNGNEIKLRLQLYGKSEDEFSGTTEFILILYGENELIWLTFHDKGWFDGTSFTTTRSIFEYKDGVWIFVKDFEHVENSENMKKSVDFIKEKYKLELR